MASSTDVDPEEEAFVDAILAAPADDAPRLVYSDWLLERGDPRGELIAVQCARLRLEEAGERRSDAYRTARRRERQLLAEHIKSWVDPVGLRNWHGTHERGLFARLTISVAGLRTRWPVFARWPLRSMTLASARESAVVLGDIRWVMGLPQSTNLEHLRLMTAYGEVGLDPRRLVRELASAGHLPDDLVVWPRDELLPVYPLRPCVNEVHFWSLDPRTLASIPRTEWPALRSFYLGSSEMAPEELLRILLGPSLRSLEVLSLMDVAEPCATEIFERCAFPALRSFSLRRGRGDAYPGAIARAFVRNGTGTKLKELRAAFVLDEELAGTIATTRFEVLQLHATPAGAHLLLGGAPLERLHELTLDHGADAAEVMRALDTDALPALAKLALSSMPLADDGAVALAAARALDGVLDIDLTRCGIGDRGGRALAESVHLARVDTLDLRENPINDGYVRWLLSEQWQHATVHLDR